MYLIQNEDGTWSEKKKPYATIECAKEEDFKFIQKAVEHLYNGGGWIPVENPPKDNDYILISFENFSVPQVGRYEKDDTGGGFYLGDESETCISQDLIVNAWQPLPKPYEA